MGKVPTLQEWSPLKFDGEMKYNKTDMIEFAKLHVEAALKAANKNAKVKSSGHPHYKRMVTRYSIINAYPLENIK